MCPERHDVNAKWSMYTYKCTNNLYPTHPHSPGTCTPMYAFNCMLTQAHFISTWFGGQSCTRSGGHSQKHVSLLNLCGSGHFSESGIGLSGHRHVQVSKSTSCGESQVMSQMSLQLQVLRLNSWPGGQVVFVTSGQGGSETHLQISRSLLNSSSGI